MGKEGLMPALESGVRAPDIQLSFSDGKPFSLAEALKHGPVLAAFYKVSCPVCQFTFPYLERLFKAYGASGKVTFVGISQDNAQDTKAFNREFGVTFPSVLDTKGYAVSRAYGLTNVPSAFLISPDGEIEQTSVGWSKKDVLELSYKLSKISGLEESSVFVQNEKVPEYKPG